MKESLSERVRKMQPSATIAMAARAREMQAQGISVINLSLGEPDFGTPQVICDAAKSALDEGYTHYPPVPGLIELRESICRKLQRDNQLHYTPQNIVVSNGAKQSIANVLLSILNPDDEIIVFAPYWVSYSEMVRLTGAKMIPLHCEVSNGYLPDPQALKELITSKTKAVLYSSPCNPTGAAFSEELIREIAEVLKPHPHIVVISDEIYEYIRYEGQHFSIAQVEGFQERTALINGFSKGFAMTGWRLGYLAGPEWLARACTKIQSQFTSGAHAYGQKAAAIAYEAAREDVHTMVEAFRRRRSLIMKLIEGIPHLQCPTPQGAFYIFPDVSAYFGKTDGKRVIHTSEDLAMYLLEEAHVATVPGTPFGAPRCIRISYAASEEDITTAMERIGRALQALH